MEKQGYKEKEGGMKVFFQKKESMSIFQILFFSVQLISVSNPGGPYI